MSHPEFEPENHEVASPSSIRELIELARAKTEGKRPLLIHGSESRGVDLQPPDRQKNIISSYNISYSVGAGMSHSSGLPEICTVQRNDIKSFENGGQLIEVVRYRVVDTPDGEPAIEKHRFLDERRPTYLIKDEDGEDEEVEAESYEMLYGDSTEFVESVHQAIRSEQASRETGLAMVYEDELRDLIDSISRSKPWNH